VGTPLITAYFKCTRDPLEGGWQCFEGPGVEAYRTGESAKDDAIGYAKARARLDVERFACSTS